jgi:hypothetical protein
MLSKQVTTATSHTTGPHQKLKYFSTIKSMLANHTPMAFLLQVRLGEECSPGASSLLFKYAIPRTIFVMIISGMFRGVNQHETKHKHFRLALLACLQAWPS